MGMGSVWVRVPQNGWYPGAALVDGSLPFDLNTHEAIELVLKKNPQNQNKPIIHKKKSCCDLKRHLSYLSYSRGHLPSWDTSPVDCKSPCVPVALSLHHPSTACSALALSGSPQPGMMPTQ